MRKTLSIPVVFFILLIGISTETSNQKRNKRHELINEDETPFVTPIDAPNSSFRSISARSIKPVVFMHRFSDVCTNTYQFICQKKGDTSDFSGIVKPDLVAERQVYDLYRQISEKNPKWDSQQIDEELADQIFTTKRRNRISSAYLWVQRSMTRMIDRQPSSIFSATEKKALESRIKNTQLELPPPATVYADEPDLFTKSEVYYERLKSGRTRLRIGGAYLLVSRSWFNWVFTLAHELAHSIDPCEMKVFQIIPNAYQKITDCFIRNKFIDISPKRVECGNNDQTSEVFADWVATFITAEALRHYSAEFEQNQIIFAARNSVRDLCEQESDEDPLDSEYHPAPRIRIEKIFAQNPEIRKLLGCESFQSTPSYCKLE